MSYEALPEVWRTDSCLSPVNHPVTALPAHAGSTVPKPANIELHDACGSKYVLL